MATMTGKPQNAARNADAMSAVKKTSRQANEARARDRLRKLLRRQLAAKELGRRLAEGARFTDERACRIAMQGYDRSAIQAIDKPRD